MAFEVDIPCKDPSRFRDVLPPERFEEFERECHEARGLLDGHVVWNVNATARGGGVVELVRPLVAYARGAGFDTRWLVIEGTPDFFTVTKRIHNRLHGSLGDSGPLDETARRIYDDVLAENLAQFVDRVHPNDVVILHDPQTAGMVHDLHAAGAIVIWRCHVGLDTPNDLALDAWAFLQPYLLDADAYVFSREAFAWEGLDRDKIVIIAPTIDVFSPKNCDLDPETVRSILLVSGLVAGAKPPAPPTFPCQDGTPGRVERRARMFEDEPLQERDPVVLQVSRWDALKDPIGVIEGFARQVPAETGAHLVYAAPAVEAVSDDPEGEQVMREALEALEALPAEARRRIHLAVLPMDDLDENAVMVNALQRHARVIVQKSLAEGFGLTVAEAMWKARPVVASRIGGIQEQITDGETGLLLDDPRDLEAYGAAVTSLLMDRARAQEIGRLARKRVRDRFTSVRSLLDYLALIRRLSLVVSP
jgi:trehalose synthase